MISFVPAPSDPQGRLGYSQIGLGYKPTTSAVMGAYASSALRGPGSAIDDIEARTIADMTGQRDQLSNFQFISEAVNFATGGLLEPTPIVDEPNVPLSEEDWKKSKLFDERIPYQEGLTTHAARLKFNKQQRADEEAFVMNQATGFQTAVGYIAGFAGSIADLKQLPINIAAAAAIPFTSGASLELRAGTLFAGKGLNWVPRALAAGDIGTAGKLASSWASGVTATGAKAIAASRTAALAGVVTEGVVSTIPTVATGMANAPITGQQYSASDAARDIFFSTILSSGIHVAGSAMHAAWKKYAPVEDVTEIGRMAASQVAAGEKINVDPLIRASAAGYTPSHLNLSEPTVRKTGDTWEASFPEETKNVYRGASEAEAIAAAKQAVLADLTDPIRTQGFSAEAQQTIRLAMEAKRASDPALIENRMVEAHPRVQEAETALRSAEAAAAAKPKPKQQKALEAARANLDSVKEEIRQQVRPEIEARKPELQAAMARADAAIRRTQNSEAFKALPDYVKSQVDNSIEARAARSIDPVAASVVSEEVPDVKFDPEEPARPLAEDELAALRADPDFAEALVELEAREAIPAAVKQLLKCKAKR